MPDRTFTLDEALSLLPVLESLLRTAIAGKKVMEEVDSIGVQVKDIDIGLLDFPCEVEGQIILLCWKMGEKSITHWHGTQEGFAGRKPIDERIARGKKIN